MEGTPEKPTSTCVPFVPKDGYKCKRLGCATISNRNGKTIVSVPFSRSDVGPEKIPLTKTFENAAAEALIAGAVIVTTKIVAPDPPYFWQIPPAADAESADSPNRK